MTRAVPLAALLILAACTPSAPAGQVVARIDGTDITRRDILVELTESGARADVDTRTVAPALLERIVARKLLAAEATRQSIDRSPEFLGRYRRTREQILGEELARRIVGRLPPPSAADIGSYVAANRARLDGRRILAVDRVTIDGGFDPAAIKPFATAAAVAAWLGGTGRKYERSTLTLDSLTLAPAHLAAIDAARGLPVAVSGKGRTLIDQVVATVPAPVAPADRARVAGQMLRGDRSRERMDRTLDRLRAKAHIEYQPGYGGPPHGP